MICNALDQLRLCESMAIFALQADRRTCNMTRLRRCRERVVSRQWHLTDSAALHDIFVSIVLFSSSFKTVTISRELRSCPDPSTFIRLRVLDRTCSLVAGVLGWRFCADMGCPRRTFEIDVRLPPSPRQINIAQSSSICMVLGLYKFGGI